MNTLNNIFRIPFKGIRVIEASAGTGKTFTIILLYLRLLLGINNKKKYLVTEILIITYTQNAKIEIQNRLSKIIYHLYIDCLSKKTKNIYFKKLFKKIKNFKEANLILKKAYIEIHNASIYTIHGFCQHILKIQNIHNEYSLTDKKNYHEEILYKKSIYIFWRKFFYPLNKEISNIIFQYWKHPDNLLLEVIQFLNIKSKIFFKKNKNIKNIIQKHKENITKITNFKKKWKYIQNLLKINFLKKKFNKRIYNNKNISKWIKKITKWTLKKTKDYIIPKELKHFNKKKIKKNCQNFNKKNFLFLDIIKKFLKIQFSLKESIIFYAIQEIPKILKKIKKKIFCFDNLITSILLSLKNNKNLAQFIEKKFPIAFIDEFQDTDNQQYNIFRKIYINKHKSSLMLIGDPKQSIYNFRGADIFFYLKNTLKISNIHTLKTNWRSSKKLIDSINFLFQRTKNTFIFKKIQYKSVLSSKNSSRKKFIINKKEQPAITFWLNKNEDESQDNYNNWIAQKCAENISYLISQIKKKKAILKTENNKKTLKIKDICILVKNFKEFEILKSKLKQKNINSYYTSYKKSIFKKNIVKEIFYILQAILNNSNEYYFNRAITTSIISKNFYTLIQLRKNHLKLSKLKDKFNKFLLIWKKKGILNLIKNIIYKSPLYQKYFFNKKNKNYIAHLIHLGEILEKKSILRQNLFFLLEWFKKKIYQKVEYNEKYFQRLIYNNKKCINITTIYKSKGLQYPIIWIPFISNFKSFNKLIFHDRKKFHILINIKKKIKNIKLEKEEKLSEEIRLLYVAITRAIFHCSIGINQFINVKNKITKFHHSGLGHILQKGQKMTVQELKDEIKKITLNKNIQIISKNLTSDDVIQNQKKKIIIQENIFKKKYIKEKNISYTKICKKILKQKNQKNKFKQKKNINKKIKLNKYTFPKGKKYGIFLHTILENIDFKKENHKYLILKELKKIKLEKKWLSIVQKWIKLILLKSFNKYKTKLCNLKKKNYIKEFEFSLPLKKNLNISLIDNILNKKKSINQTFKKNFSNQKHIMLNGKIDLMFKTNKKYYLIDYKSNFLGKNSQFYTQKYLKQEITNKKYYIQYYLYSIALHRFLKLKLKNYKFKKNFGGIYYIFLRGINQKNKNGIFFYSPSYQTIKKINHHFFIKQKNIIL
ncbi:RecBCD enzyme subunit RecB [Buchnera aphidicola (Chaitophorus populicola)]|uniref:exodeoxyribonuclease V subunit beta n=1 Tax=Buchnera aphidicola TaxID=9 RepID=UPI003463DD78